MVFICDFCEDVVCSVIPPPLCCIAALFNNSSVHSLLIYCTEIRIFTVCLNNVRMTAHRAMWRSLGILMMSFLRERFMSALKPFVVTYSKVMSCLQNVFRDREKCSVSLTSILIQFCASLCTIWRSEHSFPFVYERKEKWKNLNL